MGKMEISEQEFLMWKHTAEVYELRYESMRTLATVSAVVSTVISLITIVLMLLLLSK